MLWIETSKSYRDQRLCTQFIVPQFGRVEHSLNDLVMKKQTVISGSVVSITAA